MKNLTMSDIAKIAGVSLKTVSRVVNNSFSVKEETRQKVLNVIKEEGYMVNILAKGLREKKTNTIIIFVDKHKGGYWSIWHNEIIRQLIIQSKIKGYKIIISPSSAEGCLDDDTDGFYLLKSGLADGAIIFDNKENDIRIKYLRENDIPFVIIGNDVSFNDTCCVDLDNFKAGYLGGKHLIDKGYKNIYFFLGGKEFVVSQNRAKGFLKACEEAEGVQKNIIYDINNTEIAYIEALEIFKNKEVDAFFISGDERAMGVYRAANELGFSIPEDIAVLGIDNISLSNYIYPPMSTIDQSVDLFGKHAVDILLELINTDSNITKRILIPPKLVIRKST